MQKSSGWSIPLSSVSQTNSSRSQAINYVVQAPTRVQISQRRTGLGQIKPVALLPSVARIAFYGGRLAPSRQR